MKSFILKNKLKIIFAFLGAISGLIYWKFAGCTSGTCPLVSVWYRSAIAGLLLGYLIGDLLSDLQGKRDKKKNEKRTFSEHN